MVATVVLYAISLEGLIGAIGHSHFAKGKGFEVVLTYTLVEIEGQTCQNAGHGCFGAIEQATVGKAHLGLLQRIILVAHQVNVVLGHGRVVVGSESLYHIRAFVHLVGGNGVGSAHRKQGFQG